MAGSNLESVVRGVLSEGESAGTEAKRRLTSARGGGGGRCGRGGRGRPRFEEARGDKQTRNKEAGGRTRS